MFFFAWFDTDYSRSSRLKMLTMIFAFLLVSFNLSCGQVPFRLHHAHAAASTSGKAIRMRAASRFVVPTFNAFGVGSQTSKQHCGIDVGEAFF